MTEVAQMFGIPTTLLTGTKEYRESQRGVSDRASGREITLAMVLCFYAPIAAGVAWAWLHEYSPIQYWLSVALVQAFGLFVFCSFLLVQSLGRARSGRES